MLTIHYVKPTGQEKGRTEQCAPGKLRYGIEPVARKPRNPAINRFRRACVLAFGRHARRVGRTGRHKIGKGFAHKIAHARMVQSTGAGSATGELGRAKLDGMSFCFSHDVLPLVRRWPYCQCCNDGIAKTR